MYFYMHVHVDAWKMYVNRFISPYWSKAYSIPEPTTQAVMPCAMAAMWWRPSTAVAFCVPRAMLWSLSTLSVRLFEQEHILKIDMFTSIQYTTSYHYISLYLYIYMILGGQSIQREGLMVKCIDHPAVALADVTAPRKCLPSQEAEQRCESCGVQLEDEMILGCPTLGREPLNIPLLIGCKKGG